MTTSGAFSFQMSNASILFEAFDRIGVRPPQVDRHMMISARNSMNLEFIDWEDAGFNFWKLTSGTIALVAGQAVYQLPSSLVTLTDVWYTNVNALGAGSNSDRIMTPMQRSEYAQISNKDQQGTPYQYWFQMLVPPQITLWEVPAIGAPNYVVNWYGLQQMQDANMGSGETPDVPRRALEALTARMAFRLCEKFGPQQPQARQALMSEKKALADDAWEKFQRRDQEPGPTLILPNVAGYARMGR